MLDEKDKEISKLSPRLTVIILIFLVIFLVFLAIPSYHNPITKKGEAIGIFVNGSHRGYGKYCGQYPVTWIRLRNATYNPYDWFGEATYCDFYFGNEWCYVDKMEVGIKYKIWYHEESRPSDISSSHNVYYYVIDGCEKI